MAVVMTSVVAYVTQYKRPLSSVNTFTKVSLIVLFITSQIYMVASSVMVSPTFSMLPSLLATPLFIALLSYLFLSYKEKVERWFYAAVIGLMYETFITVVWEFQTDPLEPAGALFGFMSIIVALVGVVLLVWQIRRHRPRSL